MSERPVWKAINAFSLPAVKEVLGAAIDLAVKERGGVSYIVGRDADLELPLTDEQLSAIARASPLRYWTDGRHLWWYDAGVPDRRKLQNISAAEALERFGLDALDEAYEKGSWGWGIN
jgi:hypothetical protein